MCVKVIFIHYLFDKYAVFIAESIKYLFLFKMQEFFVSLLKIDGAIKRNNTLHTTFIISSLY